MPFDTKARKVWAILAIPGVLLGIGASYEHDGFAGLRDLTFDVLQHTGLYRETPVGDTANSAVHDLGAGKPSVTLAADEIFWLTIKDSHAASLFEEFLRKFPASPHAKEARAKLTALENARQATMGQPHRMPMREQGYRPMMTPPGAATAGSGG